MGIFTNYGRYVKAREFKKFCNSGGGLWFAFGAGGKDWSVEKGMPKAPPCNDSQHSTQNTEPTQTEDNPMAPTGSVNPKYRPCPCGCGCMVEVPVTSWGENEGDWQEIPSFTYTLPVMMILTTQRSETMSKFLSEHPLCMQINTKGKAELYFAYMDSIASDGSEQMLPSDPLFVSDSTRISAREILKAYHDGYDKNAYAIVFRDYYLTNGNEDGTNVNEYPATRSKDLLVDDDTEKGFCIDLSGLRHGLIQFTTVSSSEDPRLNEKPGSKKQVFNEDGTPKQVIKKDELGNTVLDADGLVVYENVYEEWTSAELQVRKTNRYTELRAQPFLVLTDNVRARSNDMRNKPTTEDESSGSTTGTGNKTTEYGSEYEDTDAARYLNGFATNGSPYPMPLTDMERDRNYPIFPVSYLDDLNDTENDYSKPLYIKDNAYYEKRTVLSDSIKFDELVNVPEVSDIDKYKAFQRRRHRWILSGWYNAFNFLTMVKGSAELVCEADKEEADTFLYGGRFWRLATDDMFPTYVLIRANLNPFAISKYPEVDRAFIVKQVCVYHMKENTYGANVLRSEDYVLDVGQAIPSDSTKLGVIKGENLEFVMNDYMVSANRVPQQIDRFGYIIGF